jgi:hypothetical protein
MQKASLGILGLLWLLQTASANTLVIFAKEVVSPPGDPLVYQVLLGMSNPDTQSDVSLAGWQLNCEVHSVNASGYVHFAPSNPCDRPPNYVFDAYSAALGDYSPTALLVSDYSAYERVIPPGAGADLLQLNLVCSPDASGQFDIVAIMGDETGSG